MKYYKIIDKDGIELPGHYSGRYRTFEEATKLIQSLNIDGEYRPYSIEEVR